MPLRPSAMVRHGWVWVHLVVAGLAVAAAAHAVWALAALSAVGLSAWRSSCRARRAAPWCHLSWQADELCLMDHAGEQAGLLRSAPLITPWLILLDWQGPRGRERLALFGDSAAPEDLRRLRVRLNAWCRYRTDQTPVT